MSNTSRRRRPAACPEVRLNKIPKCLVRFFGKLGRIAAKNFRRQTNRLLALEDHRFQRSRDGHSQSICSTLCHDVKPRHEFHLGASTRATKRRGKHTEGKSSMIPCAQARCDDSDRCRPSARSLLKGRSHAEKLSRVAIGLQIDFLCVTD